MSNQIVISSGAKVRSLEGVLTGTAGIVNSVPLGGANGVATLDSLGKVPLSQLPASVVTYLGTWNAATNTPTLTNGVGDVGDLYICNVAGTVNFGAGPITFAVSDWVIYSGTEWQKSSGASGTVTSVAVTESGDALTITGSPITTSGTINIGFAGTGSQYIKGDGTLATFPTTIDQAKRLITEVYNSTGATLSKGTVVYINGGQGNLPTVTKAQANADNTSAQTYGVVQSDITNNNNGFVVVIGSLTDIDTQAYAVGTQLYLSGTTAGDWTSTKPSAPIHLVYVGIVVRSHPTQGVVEIRIQNGYELEELHDVAISAPVNNQGIFYNSSNDLWENKSIATALGYTPANDALVVHLAGTETITGAKTFTDNTIFSASPLFDQSANYKVGASLVGTGNYIAMAFDKSGTGSGSILSMKLADGTTAKAINLDFLGSPATYTYTFPDLSGTLALLEGTQTFSGNKTFSALTAFTFLNGTRMDYGLYLSKGSVPSAFSGSTVNIYSDSGNNNLVVRDNSNTSLLQFQSASNYTYTFPASSGTLALTSNLSSYVPYTGATAAVNLGSNALTALTLYSNAGLALSNSGQFTGGGGYTAINGRTDGIDIRPNNGGIFQFIFSNTTNRTYTLPDATGTIALTSDLSSYLPLTGGTLTGDLKLDNGSADGGQLVLASSGFSDWNIDNFSGTLRAYYGATERFRLTNAGAATFSSSVTAGQGLFTSSSFPLDLTANTNNYGIRITSVQAPTLLLYSSNANSSNRNWGIFTNSEVYGDFDIRQSNAKDGDMTVGANSTSRLYIRNTGNVGIGTNAPDRLLQISNTAGQAVFSIIAADNDSADIFFGDNANKAEAVIRFVNGSNDLRFLNGGTERMRITSGGDVGIGGSISNQRLYVKAATSNGTTNAFLIHDSNGSDLLFVRSDGLITTGGAVSPYNFNPGGRVMYVNSSGQVGSNPSTRESKININPISDVSYIYDLNPVSFYFRKTNMETYEYTDEYYDEIRYGFIADEVEPLNPDLVSYNINEDGTKKMAGVEYISMIPVLVKAIQELSAKVTALENK